MLANDMVAEMGSNDEYIIIADGVQPLTREMIPNDPRIIFMEYGPTHDFGNHQRDIGIAMATRQYIIFIDDDNALVPGTLNATIRPALTANPGVPHLFRWVGGGSGRSLKYGDVGAPQFVCPNIPDKLGVWQLGDYKPPYTNPEQCRIELDFYNYFRDYIFIRNTIYLHGQQVIFHNDEIQRLRPWGQ